jgi:hypothetical protein
VAKPSHTTVNHGQQIYVNFEDAIPFPFSSDHLTIHAGYSSKYRDLISGELVAKLVELENNNYNPLRFCVEASYQIPSTPGSWPSFYFYRSQANPSISDEIDVEQPVKARTNGTDVYRVYLHNHPSEGTIVPPTAPGFDSSSMSYFNSNLPPGGYSAGPHSYTVCYDNHSNNNCGTGNSCTIDKYIDGTHIYTATDNWSW